MMSCYIFAGKHNTNRKWTGHSRRHTTWWWHHNYVQTTLFWHNHAAIITSCRVLEGMPTSNNDTWLRHDNYVKMTLWHSYEVTIYLFQIGSNAANALGVLLSHRYGAIRLMYSTRVAILYAELMFSYCVIFWIFTFCNALPLLWRSLYMYIYI